MNIFELNSLKDKLRIKALSNLSKVKKAQNILRNLSIDEHRKSLLTVESEDLIRRNISLYKQSTFIKDLNEYNKIMSELNRNYKLHTIEDVKTTSNIGTHNLMSLINIRTDTTGRLTQDSLFGNMIRHELEKAGVNIFNEEELSKALHGMTIDELYRKFDYVKDHIGYDNPYAYITNYGIKEFIDKIFEDFDYLDIGTKVDNVNELGIY